MILVLDTHAAIWWGTDDSRLSEVAAAALADAGNVRLLSSVVVWEVAIKRGLGKLRVPRRYLAALLDGGAEPLSISFDHAQGVEDLPPHHGDPFDRLLIAQALAEGATIVSADPLISQYDVPVLW